MDKPRGAPEGSRLPDHTKRTILMLKEAHPDWGVQRISDMLVRGPALPASPTAIARVLHEAGNGPSRCQCQVGSPMKCFEACSAFSYVKACLLAGRLPARCIEGFCCFVTSAAASIATGWSESCRVGVALTEVRHLCTAHTDHQIKR